MITGWTITAILMSIVAALIVYKAGKGKRSNLLVTGLLSCGLFVALELVLSVIGISTDYSTRTGMGHLGVISVEIGLIYLSGGVIAQYAVDKLIEGSGKRDLKRAALVLAIANGIIVVIGAGGTPLYSLAIVGSIGFITAKKNRMKLLILAMAFGAGAQLFEYWNHDTVFRTQTSLIVFFTVLCIGYFLGGGGDE